jgi:DNA-directed RNA polymerase specialized sigma24 family protein
MQALEEDFGLETIGAGKRQAFELLCHEYYGTLTHFLSLLLPTVPTRELSEDIFAEVWTRASDGPPNLTALTLILSIGLEQAAEFRAAPGALTDDSRSAVLGESPMREAFRHKLGELQWEQRVVATLVYGMSLPLQTIAQITAMSDQEISSHLAGARQQLRPRGQQLT